MINRPKFIASSLVCLCGSWLAASTEAAPAPAPAKTVKATAAVSPTKAAPVAPKPGSSPAAPVTVTPADKAPTPDAKAPAKPGATDAKAAVDPKAPAVDPKAAAADSKAAPGAVAVVPAGAAKPAAADSKDGKAPVIDPKAAAADPKAPAPAGAGAPGAAGASAAPGATPEPPKPPTPEAIAEAKQRFDRGIELYGEGDYPLALIEFNRAYELVPNYRVLYNIGQVCIQLGQYANARRALREYRERGGDELSNNRRESVAKDIEMLERRTAFLQITTNVPDAEVLVDEVVVGKTPLATPLLVDAGVHRVTVRRTGFLPKNSRVTLAGGDEQTLPLVLEVQPEEKPTIVVQRPVVEDDSSTLVIAGWVTTGALAAGAIVTGIMGAGEAKELKELRAADPADHNNLGARIDSTKSNASSLLLASDVFSGAAVIVGGLSLWLTVSPPESAMSSQPERPAPTPAKGGLQVGYQHNQVKLRGSF
jgi:hypothetical protein